MSYYYHMTLKLNIVYPPREVEPEIVYQNKMGEIWNSGQYNPKMKNIGMGLRSITNPQKNKDSFLLMEPYCVSSEEYQIEYLENFKYIFTWANKAFENTKIKNKIIHFNHPSCQEKPNPENLLKEWTSWENRKNEIIFIANNKSSTDSSELYSFRLQLADLLHQHGKYQVKWYGQIPVDKPYYHGSIDNKKDILSQAKFSVCTENCYDENYSWNYFTEKMPEVWFAGCIPIYFGCYNIDQFNFVDHSYIDLRVYCKKENEKWKIDLASLLSRIENLGEDRYNNFKEDVVYNIIKPEKNLYQVIDFNNMYQKILETYSKNV